ncbi:MAG: hypothetical protein RR782_02820 [Clostridium sp.]
MYYGYDSVFALMFNPNSGLWGLLGIIVPLLIGLLFLDNPRAKKRADKICQIKNNKK